MTQTQLQEFLANKTLMTELQKRFPDAVSAEDYDILDTLTDGFRDWSEKEAQEMAQAYKPFIAKHLSEQATHASASKPKRKATRSAKPEPAKAPRPPKAKPKAAAEPLEDKPKPAPVPRKTNKAASPKPAKVGAYKAPDKMPAMTVPAKGSKLTTAEAHLVRYHRLNHKVLTEDEILRMLNRLQNDIRTQAIRSTDPNAERIASMQDTLIRAARRAATDRAVEFRFKPQALSGVALLKPRK